MVNRFIPNIGDVAANREELAWPDALHTDALQAAYKPDGVLNGCVITDGGSGLEVDVAAGCVVINGVAKTVAGQTVAAAAADGSNPRLDLVTINTSGTLVINTGTPATVPVYDTIPTNEVVIGGIMVAASVATLVTGDINDMRVDLSRIQYVMHRIAVPTGPVSSVSEVTVFTYTIPGRSLGLTGGLRVTLYGNSVYADSSPTLILKVKLGATTVFTSNAQVHTTNADPRNWKMIIDLINDASFSVQHMYAHFEESPADADEFQLGVGSTEDARLARGYAGVAEDLSADKALVVTAQLSVDNAFNSFKAQVGVVERLGAA